MIFESYISRLRASVHLFIFFFNDTATTEIYTLSLHDALPICEGLAVPGRRGRRVARARRVHRSEEHTSELQSRQYLVCRLLLEKKKRQLQCIISRDSPWAASISMPYPVGLERFFFFNDTATTEIYTLSLHDALPI